MITRNIMIYVLVISFFLYCIHNTPSYMYLNTVSNQLSSKGDNYIAFIICM